MEEAYFKRIMTTIIFVILIALAFFLVKPVLLSIVAGFLLAFIFTPLYRFLYKYTKSKNLSATLISFLVILIIIIPFWLLTPIMIEQSIKIYTSSQEMDFITPLKKIFPSFFKSEQFSNEIGNVLHSFVTKATNSLMNIFSDIILNFPTLSLQLLVVAFTFFFVLRDEEELVAYIKTLLPFPKEVESKLFSYTKGITSSVIYGQIIIGLIQGVLTSIGFFLFGVPNALLLSLFALLAGVLPIIGTAIVWLPIVIYLLVAGNTFPAFGITFFGILSSVVDNFLRPFIVSKKTKIHSSLILIGMIGGLFLFGVLGLVLGPLILAYLMIILELYRDKRSSEIFKKN